MQDASTTMTTPAQTIVLGGGCFWCTEAVFVRVRGVLHVRSGYANGHVLNPTYEQVCTGETGHNEVVRLAYDPTQVSLRQLLEIFMATHDPTTLNRQGHDVGTQYRSGIYYSNEADREVAHAVLDETQAALDDPVATELAPLQCFYEAEAYHHNYFERHPDQGYCALVVAPKVQKFVQTFAAQVCHD